MPKTSSIVEAAFDFRPVILTNSDPFAALRFPTVFVIDMSGYWSVTKSIRLAFVIINALSTVHAISLNVARMFFML